MANIESNTIHRMVSTVTRNFLRGNRFQPHMCVRTHVMNDSIEQNKPFHLSIWNETVQKGNKSHRPHNQCCSVHLFHSISEKRSRKKIDFSRHIEMSARNFQKIFEDKSFIIPTTDAQKITISFHFVNAVCHCSGEMKNSSICSTPFLIAMFEEKGGDPIRSSRMADDWRERSIFSLFVKRKQNQKRKFFFLFFWKHK